ARVRLVSGRWLTVHADSLTAPDAGDERIAIVLAPAGPAEMTPLRLELHGLSAREAEVTRLLVRGFSNDEIARALHITRYTVKDHTKAIYSKLDVAGRHELTAKLFDEHHLPTLNPAHLREFAPNRH